MMKRLLLILVLALAPAAGASEQVWIQTDDPKSVEIKNQLTRDQTLQIAEIQKTFAEVDILPLDAWLEGFRKDSNPDREIAIWKRIADIYTEFLKGRPDITPEYKKEVFKVLVASSSMPRENVPESANVKILTAKEVIELMDRYYGGV